MKNYEKNLGKIFFIVVSSIALLSCPKTISVETYQQLKDITAPGIELSWPAEGSSYASTVVVTGTVTDKTDENDESGSGAVVKVSYEILNTDIVGDAVLDGNSFTFSFSTRQLSGTLSVRITVTDWNGNTTVKTLTLYDNGAIPDFYATPGNGEITLSWDEVAEAESYTLYYERLNSIPNEEMTDPSQVITTDGLTLTIDNLENGQIHTFLLKANCSDGVENWSDVIKCIPLSEVQLCPELSPEQDYIQVTWKDIKGTDTYQVWKSASANGTYYNVSGDIEQSYYTDYLVEPGKNYYYKIVPADYCDILSYANTAELPGPVPYRCREQFSVSTPNFAFDVKVSGNYAYMADNYNGVRIIDITDNENPYEVASFDNPGTLVDMELGNGYIFFAICGEEGVPPWSEDVYPGLHMIDVSNPLSPFEAGFYELPMSTEINYLYYYEYDDKNYIIAKTGALGFDVYDVTAPSSIGPVASYDTPTGYNAEYIAYLDNVAVIVDSYGSLYYVLISDPESPTLFARDVTSTIRGGGVNEIFIRDDGTAFVVDEDPSSTTETHGLRILDISNPISYSSVPELSFSETTGAAKGVKVVGDYAYVADDYHGLHIIDISDTSAPVDCGYIKTMGESMRVDVDSGTAYIADGPEGLSVVDVVPPIVPVLRGDMSPRAKVLVYDDYLFCPNDSGPPVYIYNVSDPDLPVVEASKWGITVNNIDKKGDILYAVTPSQLLILDVSDLSKSAFQWDLGSLEIYAIDIEVSGNYAYITAGSYGMYVVDISNDENPIRVGHMDTPSGYAKHIEVYGDYAYMTDGDTGILIVDISTPTEPFIAGTYPSVIYEDEFFIKGDYLYMRDGSTAFQIVDISNPSVPVQKSTITVPANVTDVYVDGDYAYTACNNTSTSENTLEIINVSDPENPWIEESVDVAASYVEVSGKYAYIGGNDGLQIIQLTD